MLRFGSILFRLSDAAVSHRIACLNHHRQYLQNVVLLPGRCYCDVKVNHNEEETRMKELLMEVSENVAQRKPTSFGKISVGDFESSHTPTEVTSDQLSSMAEQNLSTEAGRQRKHIPKLQLLSLDSLNNNETLLKLLNLKVDLKHIEYIPGAIEYLSKLDFDLDVKPRLEFLIDLGFLTQHISKILTIYPFILAGNLSDIEERVGYLKKAGFKKYVEMIAKQPTVLSMSVVSLDRRLGQIQDLFGLENDQVVTLMTGNPKLFTFTMKHIRTIHITLMKSCGFRLDDIKTMILEDPKLPLADKRFVFNNYVYLRKVIGLTNSYLKHFPKALYAQTKVLKPRIDYLKFLNKIQFDPELPHYISLNDVVTERDYEFCQSVAKTNVTTYRDFQKTR